MCITYARGLGCIVPACSWHFLLTRIWHTYNCDDTMSMRHIDQFAQRIFLALENSLSKYNINTNLQLGKNGFYPVDTSFEWRCLFDDESMWRLLDKLPHLKFSGTAKQLTTKPEREMEEWSEFTTRSTSRRTLTLELVCCVWCVNFHKSNAWKSINWH